MTITTTRTGVALAAIPVVDENTTIAAKRDSHLSTLYDAFSIQRINPLFGLNSLKGKRCLIVGAGVGARMAVLAGQVNPTGHVLALDHNPCRPLVQPPHLTVAQHDLTSGPPPVSDWNLAYVRHALAQHARRREILSWLIGTLAPGGVILVEELDASQHDNLMTAPDTDAAELYHLVQQSVDTTLLPAVGLDPTWPRSRAIPGGGSDGRL
jgi:hypothetical protein